jgi:hypothetical protein
VHIDAIDSYHPCHLKQLPSHPPRNVFVLVDPLLSETAISPFPLVIEDDQIGTLRNIVVDPMALYRTPSTIPVATTQRNH